MIAQRTPAPIRSDGVKCKGSTCSCNINSWRSRCGTNVLAHEDDQQEYRQEKGDAGVWHEAHAQEMHTTTTTTSSAAAGENDDGTRFARRGRRLSARSSIDAAFITREPVCGVYPPRPRGTAAQCATHRLASLLSEGAMVYLLPGRGKPRIQGFCRKTLFT